MPPIALTLAEQQEDLAYLRRKLEQYHPGLHVYSDDAALDEAFARAEAGFEEGASPLAFFADLSLGVEAIGCTHTSFHGMPLRAEQGGFFPLDLVVVDDRLWVDPRAHSGPPREIVSVEGIPAPELLAALRARISSDGRSLARKDVVIDRAAPLRITSVLASRATWTVETLSAGEPVRSEVLPGIRSGDTPEPAPVPRQPVLERVSDVLVVRVREFARSDRGSRRFLEDLRRASSSAGAVLLDLRGNGGGRTLSLLDLWALFAERPFVPYPEGWAKHPFGGWDEDPASPGVWRAGPEQLYSTLVPREDPLRLPVVLITDGTTASSASDLAFFFQWEGRGTVVGSETASGRWLQNCEQYLDIFLESSRLALTVPLKTLVTADVDGRGHGVVPDVIITPSVEDVAAGRDTVYERALEVAQELAAHD